MGVSWEIHSIRSALTSSPLAVSKNVVMAFVPLHSVLSPSSALLPLAHTVFRSNCIHVRRAQSNKQVAVFLLVIGELAQMLDRRNRALAIIVIESGAIAIAANAKAKASETSEKIIAVDARDERAG